MDDCKIILLVEDEALIAMSETSMLKKYGYDVVTCNSAEKAIKTVQNTNIDLILMDIDLGHGKMDGTEAAQIILREHDIPVVFLSSHTEQDVVEKTENITSYGYVVKNSGITVLDASIKMAFKLFHEKLYVSEKQRELEEINNELTAKEAFLDRVIEQSPFATFITNAEGTLLRANPALKGFLNLSDEQLVGKYNVLQDPLLEKQDLIPDIKTVFNKGKTIHFSCDWDGNDISTMNLKGSNSVSIEATMFPIHNRSGELSNVVVNWIDITESMKVNQRLITSQYYLEKAQELGNIGTWELDISKNKLLWTDENYRIFGLPLGKELTNESFLNCIHPDDREYVDRKWKNALNGEPYDIEHRIVVHDKIKWVREKAELQFDEQGTCVRALGFAQDITYRKKTEQEKEILMKELNHRTKNNLLMISSLIKLKNSALGNIVDLSDIEHQIDAIRIVYDKLNQSESIDQINEREYIRDLLDSIFTGYTSVKIECDIDDISLNLRTVAPLGLILNEIATNAIKHGFTPEGESRFTVALKEHRCENQYIFTLSNTGRPFPEKISLNNPDTLGLRLISSLVNQLNGTIELQRKPYPVFTIRFPMDRK